MASTAPRHPRALAVEPHTHLRVVQSAMNALRDRVQQRQQQQQPANRQAANSQEHRPQWLQLGGFFCVCGVLFAGITISLGLEEAKQNPIPGTCFIQPDSTSVACMDTSDCVASSQGDCDVWGNWAVVRDMRFEPTGAGASSSCSSMDATGRFVGHAPDLALRPSGGRRTPPPIQNQLRLVPPDFAR